MIAAVTAMITLVNHHDVITNMMLTIAIHMQAVESKHAAAVESLKEGWVAELKRQKEAWAAVEKARRDTWLADKTKQVKELTIKVRHSPARKPLCICSV